MKTLFENKRKGINVSEICSGYNFDITGTSYIGMPKPNTVMYVTKKVQYLLNTLYKVKECLVYAEEGIIIPNEITHKNAIILSVNPQLDFARFVHRLSVLRESDEQNLNYILTENGYYISENAKIGNNVKIEPGCVIGHGVTIGDNSMILSGCIIRHAIIGENFLCNEHAVIGSSSFTMAIDENGNKYRIPSMGSVHIGKNVEIGVNDNIACGSCGDTVLEDYVKLDALVHIGHDVHLKKNVEITAGVTIAGFVQVDEGAYIGVGAAVRNRINIGKNCIIGMGAIVTKSVESDLTVVGNPAKRFEK